VLIRPVGEAEASLWQAARLIGGITGASERLQGRIRTESEPGRDAKTLRSWAFVVEPPWGIEPQTYALREARQAVLGTLPAQIAALASRNALGAQHVPWPPSGDKVLLALAVFEMAVKVGCLPDSADGISNKGASRLSALL